VNNDNQVLEGLKLLLTVAAALNLLLYWGVVCVKLYRNGAKFPTGLLPWRYFHDLHGYRQVLAAEGKPVNLYYLMILLTWFTILLGAVVGLIVLQEANQRPPERRLQ
jgi:hypothetical protein